LTEEGKELYFHTKNVFLEELEKISPDCISPIIVIRQIVKKAMDKYIIDHCSRDTKVEEIFTESDFQNVSNKLYNEVMTKDL